MIYCDLMALEDYSLAGLALIEVQLATSTVWSLSGKHADLTCLVSDIKTVILMC